MRWFSKLARKHAAIPRGEGPYRLRRSKILSTSQALEVVAENQRNVIESLGGAVRCGRETSEQEARTGFAEAEHGLVPVPLVFERAPFLVREAIAGLA